MQAVTQYTNWYMNSQNAALGEDMRMLDELNGQLNLTKVRYLELQKEANRKAHLLNQADMRKQLEPLPEITRNSKNYNTAERVSLEQIVSKRKAHENIIRAVLVNDAQPK